MRLSLHATGRSSVARDSLITINLLGKAFSVDGMCAAHGDQIAHPLATFVAAIDATVEASKESSA